ncbi:MAG: LSU ribosomal protein L31P [Candidatus Woesebacteria bacterium GW2011_GWA1_37_8]|uniref:Large ribosomal subunit protein bL31 n=2 Tax=Candidatus Woeseibacteriota TaxID=1752722 RepID=A0A0G0LGQ6_9BACT|nr:MAG: LSU ribosomal protein L31P [Microgenomates group bacterium GW2011_GWC1_37_12b]KKQ45288.1 MAG: LSU ribosomal protein L31P [Candidatus Woesebacteria bacterium GW2011_GWA1_37_8]KKQ87090.1 MAG: LSU ribosomal protein L31P [Candidatus Woesebacteria bacterium GW2011_GWB1_38_8b]
MKAAIHPKWFEEAKVTCACGNAFVLGATVPEIKVEVCYNCHPFYTGQMKYVDTAGRVDAFKTKLSRAQTKVVSKTAKRALKREKKIQKELERPDTLEQLRKQAKKAKK